MKKSDEIRDMITRLEADDEALKESFRAGDADPQMLWWKQYWECGGRENQRKKKELEFEQMKEENREIEVGDGCTLHLWSDSYACTVIRKTAKSITIQRDKAIRNPDFKPEWVAGGFAAHCTNADEQSYTYERNENGETFVCHWSEKEGRYRHGSDGSMKVSLGRYEYYDYNF